MKRRCSSDNTHTEKLLENVESDLNTRANGPSWFVLSRNRHISAKIFVFSAEQLCGFMVSDKSGTIWSRDTTSPRKRIPSLSILFANKGHEEFLRSTIPNLGNHPNRIKCSEDACGDVDLLFQFCFKLRGPGIRSGGCHTGEDGEVSKTREINYSIFRDGDVIWS